MFYFLASYQMLSISVINMAMDLIFNPLSTVTTEELEDMLKNDIDDDFISN